MSINRPDGAFTVEFLLKEIADLKQTIADQEDANIKVNNLIKINTDLRLQVVELQSQIQKLNEEKDHQKNLRSHQTRKVNLLMSVINSHQVEEVIKQLDSDDFNGAEYFAGR